MKALIFDLDGTVLNTLEDIASACNHILKLHGYPVHSIESYRYKVGNGFEMLIKRALPESARLAPEQLSEMVQEARQYYKNHMTVNTRPYPGMEAALRKLQEQGCKLAVLSNKPDAMCKELMAHYYPQISFLRVYGARDNMPLKPDPKALLDLLNEIEVNIRDSAYVGDSNVDMETARNAGTWAIGVAWGFREPDELLKAGADAIMMTPASMLISADKN